MKYKVELIMNGRVFRNLYYKKLSHPTQAARKSINSIKNNSRYDYFVMAIANDYGEIWQTVAKKDIKGDFKIKPIRKYDFIMSKDDIDMVFTGAKPIFGGILR